MTKNPFWIFLLAQVFFFLKEKVLSKRDFVMRVKICRKEAKESRYWLKLIEVNGEGAEKQRKLLIQEATELMKIFGAILEKTK